MTDHAHVSDLRWDRWLAGELSPDDTARTIAHAESCAACSARMRELTAGRDAFQLRPVEVSFAPPRPVRRARSTAFASAAAIASVVVIVFVAGRRPRDESRSHEARPGAVTASVSGERPKGNELNLVLAAGRAPARIRVHVEQVQASGEPSEGPQVSGGRLTEAAVSGEPSALVRVSTGDVVHPGDSLQAAYTSDRDGFGAVLALDGAGAANSYVPARGDLMVGLPAGVDRSFPASTVLDRVIGKEQVVILWCQTAQPVAPLLGELRATGDVVAPAGCHVRQIVLDKREVP